jgi:VWFA-related protein
MPNQALPIGLGVRRASLRAALAGVCVSSALSAHALAGSTQSAVTTFRTDTRLVQVNVVVHDQQGRPVPDLTRGDFTVYEGGKEQPLDLFSIESDRLTTEVPILAPGDFSNRLDGRVGGSVSVILFDRLNTLAQDQRQARDQLVKFLGQIQREDRVALYTLESNSIRVLHDFTNDSASLMKVLAGQGVRTPLELDATETEAAAPLAAWLRGTAPSISASLLGDRVGTTLNALATIAYRLAGVRGRKNLIWVSSAFPLVLRTNGTAQLLDRATRAVDDANIAIYPVDARGLTAARMMRVDDPPDFKSGPPVPDAPRRVSSSSTPPNIDAMKALAADTGGRAFFNSNDISSAVRQAIDDGRLTYVLGYYPLHAKWDGAFREITVKVNRPGVDVRYRRGYLALPLVAASRVAMGASAREKALLAEVRQPLEATGIGLTAHVSRAESADAPSHSIAVALHLDPGAVTFEQHGEKWTGSLDLAIAQHTADDRWFETEGASLDLDVTDARRDQLIREGLRFTRTIKIRDDTDSLRIALRNVATGATGSLIIPATALTPHQKD